jgi:hypothetical protein
MPRGRGGKRDGVVGKNYANRTDLQGQNVVSAQPQNQPGVKLANATATGQPYGAATAQENAMKALPIQNTGMPAVTTPEGQPTPRGQQTLTPLDAPGDPNQSLFHGMDNIPGGAGSEALAPTFQADVAIKALGLLNQLGSDISPQVALAKDYLNARAANGATR